MLFPHPPKPYRTYSAQSHRFPTPPPGCTTTVWYLALKSSRLCSEITSLPLMHALPCPYLLLKFCGEWSWWSWISKAATLWQTGHCRASEPWGSKSHSYFWSYVRPCARKIDTVRFSYQSTCKYDVSLFLTWLTRPCWRVPTLLIHKLWPDPIYGAPVLGVVQ